MGDQVIGGTGGGACPGCGQFSNACRCSDAGKELAARFADMLRESQTVRDLTPDECRIINGVTSKLLELDIKGVARPTHVAVNKQMFLGVGELLGMKVVRVGYIDREHAALLLITDDLLRWPSQSVEPPK